MKSSEEWFQAEQSGVERFERDYHLPPLVGSDRQVLYGRLVRHEFLKRLLGRLIEATKSLRAEAAREVFETAHRVRVDRKAKNWIEVYKDASHDPIAFVVGLPAAEKANKQIAEAQARKAQESRKLTKAAAAFEKEVGLPEIVSPCSSTSQRNFARRCRYLLLSKVPAQSFDRVLARVTNITQAGVWIAAYVSGDGLNGLASDDGCEAA